MSLRITEIMSSEIKNSLNGWQESENSRNGSDSVATQGDPGGS